ncbi:hypothetical protein AYI69_g364 [Smittium culicis]|uniref:Phytanoyl-CoA dioxygenase n=1 Tax=Smittium culicis TaxID=133412 RepID=A0A1R1X656_9FUNG|nr:hypothetical protein AYI69_g10377 [Smittium culicis]OMJ30104.1 hypothetical protein AYI69_g364 [Smittium culicis]
MKKLSVKDIISFNNNGFLVVNDFLTPHEISYLKEEAIDITNRYMEQGDLETDFGCIVEPFGLDCEYNEHKQKNKQKFYNKSDFDTQRAKIKSKYILQIIEKYSSFAKQLLNVQNSVFLVSYKLPLSI